MMKASRLEIAIALLGVGGLGGLAFGAFVDLETALSAYLAGFGFALSLTLGSLLLVVVAHLTRARWMLAYRRLAELVAASIFVLAPALIPILLGAPHLYEWAQSNPTAIGQEHHHHSPWLTLPFFTVRSLICFAVWIAVAETLFRFSLKQDPALPHTTARLYTFAAASIWPLVLTLSSASLDFFMSLDAGWISSMYPVYFFAGSFLSALAVIGLISRTVEEINPSHRHALGKLELTFVIFWAYIAFCQFMLIWIADIPHEVPWYLVRMEGVWGSLSVALIVGHFALPFFLLLSRSWKRRQGFLTGMGMWLLFVHWLDMVWLIAPSTPAAPSLNAWWLHLSAFFFFVGLLSTTARLRASGRPLVVRGDPRFAEALRYRTQ